MKRFVFPLARVLDWRRLELRREESRLEQLHGELHALDAGLALLNQQAAEAETELREHVTFRAEDLAALHSFQQHAAAERVRIAQAQAACRQRIAAQMPVVLGKKRDVKLLETLEEKQRAAWVREEAREIAQQGEESHLARSRLARSDSAKRDGRNIQ